MHASLRLLVQGVRDMISDMINGQVGFERKKLGKRSASELNFFLFLEPKCK